MSFYSPPPWRPSLLDRVLGWAAAWLFGAAVIVWGTWMALTLDGVLR